jgi:hypothetical protein
LNPRLQPWQGCTLPLSYSRNELRPNNRNGSQNCQGFLLKKAFAFFLTMRLYVIFKMFQKLPIGSSCMYPKLAPQPLKEEYLLAGPLEPTNEPYAVAKIAGSWV